jgi:hypothetical protein
MRASTFKGNSFSQATRKTLAVLSWKGVDFSTQKLSVDAYHAIISNNYLYKDGLIQKRQGRSEIAVVGLANYAKYGFDGVEASSASTNSSNHINGIWHFVAEDGEKHYIAHVGKLLYELTDFDTGRPVFSLLNKGYKTISGVTYPLCYELEDYRSSAVVGKNMLWLLGGNCYLSIRFISSGVLVEPVEESDITFVPTTCIGITYADSKVSKRSLLDDPNSLTEFRYNRLLSGTGKDGDVTKISKFYEYTLDAPIYCRDEQKDMAKMTIVINMRGEAE